MSYLNQIFYEGLGKSIYLPIEKKIKKISKKLVFLWKFIYLLIAISIAVTLLLIRI